jgi:SAM-dependent MidA family methyltransferase
MKYYNVLFKSLPIKVWSKRKQCNKQLSITLVEMSSFLRKIQFKNLCDHINHNDEPELYKSYKSKLSDAIEITWVNEISEIPNNESIHFFLANEFFDALPIQKFQVYFLINFAHNIRILL